MPVRRAEIELAAVLASDEAMARLGVPAGHPLVNGTQTGYSPDGAALFHGHITVRTDILTCGSLPAVSRRCRPGSPKHADRAIWPES